jgi:hypothetical protein
VAGAMKNQHAYQEMVMALISFIFPILTAQAGFITTATPQSNA